jgi:hypothetical protein
LFTRTAAIALCVTVGFGLAAAPCTAADTPAKPSGSLTRLSPASHQLLASPPASPLAAPKLRSSEGGQQPPAGPPAAPSSFFKSAKGKVTLALMGAGVGFTVWSINHDRKPVKSPIR